MPQSNYRIIEQIDADTVMVEDNIDPACLVDVSSWPPKPLIGAISAVHRVRMHRLQAEQLGLMTAD